MTVLEELTDYKQIAKIEHLAAFLEGYSHNSSDSWLVGVLEDLTEHIAKLHELKSMVDSGCVKCLVLPAADQQQLKQQLANTQQQQLAATVLPPAVEKPAAPVKRRGFW